MRLTERQLRQIIQEELRKPDPDEDPEAWREPEDDEPPAPSRYTRRFYPVFGGGEDRGDTFISLRRRYRFT